MNLKARAGQVRVGIGFGLGIGIAGALLAGGLPLLASAMSGGSYGIVGKIVAGGGTSAGGTFSLSGIAPASAASASRGGEFIVSGGFSPVRFVVDPAVPMRVVFTTNKLAELSWPEGTEGYILEFSPTVDPGAVWTPVSPQPTGNSFITPCAQPARFFRLRKM